MPGDPGSTLAPPPEGTAQSRALHAAARPLVALATQLRQAVPAAPDNTKRALATAVERFERDLAAAGWDNAGIAAASYVLCVWVDEVVADTPWGAGGAGLLERFHGERDGSRRVLALLSRLAERPRENRALLELYHTCLSLGLTGALRDQPEAALDLERLRSRVFRALPRQPVVLAPPLRAAVPAAVPAWRRRLWPGLLVLLGLVTLGVYTASQLRLSARVDEVFASMRQIGAGAEPVAPPTVAATPAAPAPVRLAALLADDAFAGRLVVRDEVHRSVVTLPAEALFASGSTQLASGSADLLERIGAALASQGGKVLVIGHTDGTDARTARLPSAWHQSFEWAREVANALGRRVGPERLAVEGAADLDRSGAGPRRRVDIVLYP